MAISIQESANMTFRLSTKKTFLWKCGRAVNKTLSLYNHRKPIEKAEFGFGLFKEQL